MQSELRSVPGIDRKIHVGICTVTGEKYVQVEEWLAGHLQATILLTPAEVLAMAAYITEEK